MNTMNHNEFTERIAAYVAGGLDESERAGFEAHSAACAACAAALRQYTEEDRAMGQLFADIRPGMGLEDRIITGLRGARGRWKLVHPAVWRAATGLAAALVLGSVGYVGTQLMEEGRLPGMVMDSREPMAAVSAEGLAGTDGTVQAAWFYGNGRMDQAERDGRTPDELAVALGEQLRADWVDASAKGKPVANDDLRDGLAKEAESVGKKVEAEGRLHSRRAGAVAFGAIDVKNGTVSADSGTARGTSGGATDWDRPGRSLNEWSMLGLEAGKAARSDVEGNARLAELKSLYFKPETAVAESREKGVRTELARGHGVERFKESAEEFSLAVQGQPAEAPATDGPASRILGLVQAGQQATPAPAAVVEHQRKIIRNGEMQFEVDGYDSAAMQIAKIVKEEGGFVSSASSEKLANGKVKGTITVRVPPENLDTLVLKLRALGELRSQKISAQDVTKVYYDLESELRAARTMEERLLNIIKSGKGEIKDLIEAEKQLGTYRATIEKLEGEVRYYNNLVSLSTLNIGLMEKDIKQAAFAAQTEHVNMGIETDDVEKARAEALKAVEEAKGRIIDSNLKKHDAGQLSATLVCEVAPDAAGAVIDRLKQIGRVSRMDVERRQSTPGGEAAPATARVERKDTRLAISIYNLANIAPRTTTAASLAVSNVEEAYRSILEVVQANGGRIVTSNLNRQKPDHTTASISFEVPAASAEAASAELRRDRDVMSMTVTENPDTQNVTTAKRGFSVQIYSLANVAPREREMLRLATRGDVAKSFQNLVEAARKGNGRVLVSQLNQQDRGNVTGTLAFEVSRDREQEVRTALAANGAVTSRTVQRSADADNTVDSKIRFDLTIIDADKLPARETVRLAVEVAEVDRAATSVRDAVAAAGGRILDARKAADSSGRVSSQIRLDVPLAQADQLAGQIRNLGQARVSETAQDPEAPDGQVARAEFNVTLANAELLVGRDEGLMASVRNALSTSIRGLLWSLQFLVIGVLMVGPWALVIWGAWRLYRRNRAKSAAAATV